MEIVLIMARRRSWSGFRMPLTSAHMLWQLNPHYALEHCEEGLICKKFGFL